MFFLVAVTIPFLLKYGAEKGRIVMVVICGGIVAVGMLAGKVLLCSRHIMEHKQF